MRLALLVLALSACSSHDDQARDAAAVAPDLAAGAPPLDLSTAIDLSATIDFSVEPDLLDVDQTPPPDLACNPIVFQGGVDPATQGWTTTQQPPAQLTFPSAGVTQLQTSTVGGASASGQLLVSRAVGITGKAFTVEFVVKVIAVTAHNPSDAPVALMGSFTAPFGTINDRNQMIYIDSDKIGWADDSESAAASALDGQFHTYRLTVDAAGHATVSRDGTALLSRSGYVTNGTIAFGDQSNDVNLDATLQVQSISLLCP